MSTIDDLQAHLADSLAEIDSVKSEIAKYADVRGTLEVGGEQLKRTSDRLTELHRAIDETVQVLNRMAAGTERAAKALESANPGLILEGQSNLQRSIERIGGDAHTGLDTLQADIRRIKPELESTVEASLSGLRQAIEENIRSLAAEQAEALNASAQQYATLSARIFAVMGLVGVAVVATVVARLF